VKVKVNAESKMRFFFPRFYFRYRSKNKIRDD